MYPNKTQGPCGPVSCKDTRSITFPCQLSHTPATQRLSGPKPRGSRSLCLCPPSLHPHLNVHCPRFPPPPSPHTHFLTLPQAWQLGWLHHTSL